MGCSVSKDDNINPDEREVIKVDYVYMQKIRQIKLDFGDWDMKTIREVESKFEKESKRPICT